MKIGGKVQRIQPCEMKQHRKGGYKVLPPVIVTNYDIPMQSELMLLVGTAQITGNPGNAYINISGDIVDHQDIPTNSDLVLI